MKHPQPVVIALSLLVVACGTDGKAPQPGQEVAADVALPEQPLPAAVHGAWAETRYWNQGATSGPSFWSKAAVEANAISLTSGESSKDSGSWTISGRCGVLGGQGTADSPFRVLMLVEQSLGEERHPAPAPRGQAIELGIHLDGGRLHVVLPGDSLTLDREGKPATPAGPVETEFACQADGDCVNSCNHGAVNRIWYAEQYPGGERCEDGCTSKGTEPARCLDGLCVAFRLGRRADECTRRQAEIIPGPGPAHSCATDDDCAVSCTYGAVNRNWYSYSVEPGSECKDGCASKGASAKCEDGICVSYLRGERADHCTGRNIHHPRP